MSPKFSRLSWKFPPRKVLLPRHSYAIELLLTRPIVWVSTEVIDKTKVVEHTLTATETAIVGGLPVDCCFG